MKKIPTHFESLYFICTNANGEPVRRTIIEIYYRLSSDRDRTSRNAGCPCGSGKKFKHCHGALV